MSLPYPNQILSAFREGLDTVQIAERFGISESEAVRLLHRAKAFGFHRKENPVSGERGQKKASRASVIARTKNRPVTLPTLKCLQVGDEA